MLNNMEILSRLATMREALVRGDVPDNPEDTLLVALTLKEFDIILYSLTMTRITDNKMASLINDFADKFASLILAQKIDN